jgi:hypothetical protein
MATTIKSMMATAKKRIVADMEGKKKKTKKSAKEQYSELREAVKEVQPSPISFSDRYEEELKRSLFENRNTEIIEDEEIKVNLEVHVKKSIG